jgi:hypothetical protein
VHHGMVPPRGERSFDFGLFHLDVARSMFFFVFPRAIFFFCLNCLVIVVVVAVIE